MPLATGYSKAVVSSNIGTEMRAGRPQAQAVAISLRSARRAWRQRHPTGSFPKHLTKASTYRASRSNRAFGELPPSRPAKGSLYQEIKAAGISYDHHESDLYILDTPAAREILTSHPMDSTRRSYFIGTDGKRWIDVPFAYEPWWEARGVKSRNRAGGLSKYTPPGGDRRYHYVLWGALNPDEQTLIRQNYYPHKDVADDSEYMYPVKNVSGLPGFKRWKVVPSARRYLSR